MFVKYSNKINIFIGKIDYTVRTFCHCNALLLPQVRRNAQHRDRKSHDNSSFCSHLMFRIWSCILSLGMHSSSRSRTRDTTLIRGLNNGWNGAFITILKHFNSLNITSPIQYQCATNRSLAQKHFCSGWREFGEPENSLQTSVASRKRLTRLLVPTNSCS